MFFIRNTSSLNPHPFSSQLCWITGVLFSAKHSDGHDVTVFFFNFRRGKLDHNLDLLKRCLEQVATIFSQMVVKIVMGSPSENKSHKKQIQFVYTCPRNLTIKTNCSIPKYSPTGKENHPIQIQDKEQKPHLGPRFCWQSMVKKTFSEPIGCRELVYLRTNLPET